MNKLKQLLFTLVCIAVFSPKLFAQDYINHNLKMDSAIYELQVKNNAKAALSIFQEESKKFKLSGGELELMGSCLLASGDSAGAVKYFKLGISENSFGADEMGRIKNIYFGGSAKSAYYKEIESAFPELEKQYYSHQNIDVLIEIKMMVATDQFIRSNKKGYDKEKWEKLCRQVDSTNMNRVKEIYEQYGADSIDAFDICLLMMHGVNDFQDMWDYFQPRLLADIKKGKFYPDTYALLVDRRRIMVEGKDSWFGVVTKTDFLSEQMGKIDDIENVDKRRKEIGLCPLYQAAERQHQKVPEDYKR
jgi:hypothetical protein